VKLSTSSIKDRKGLVNYSGVEEVPNDAVSKSCMLKYMYTYIHYIHIYTRVSACSHICVYIYTHSTYAHLHT
jgi:hypothetical protein